MQFFEDIEPLHLYFKSSLQAIRAAGIVTHMGRHPVSDLDQLKPSGPGAAMIILVSDSLYRAGLFHTAVDMLEQLAHSVLMVALSVSSTLRIELS